MSRTRRSIREKGTGTIVKSGSHFYLKLTTGGKTKTTTLRGKDDKPVTTRKDAEAAAALLRPVLRAEQKEEIALHIAKAKKLRHEGSIPIQEIWQVYLKQYTRPDSGEETLKGYEAALRRFIDWLERERPEIRYAAQITPEEAGGYFSHIWNDRKVSGRTYNCYRQALKLIFSHILEPAGLEENPFAHIKGKPSDTESRLAFTEEQVKAIFDGFRTGFFYKTKVMRMGKGRKHVMVERTLQYEPLYKDEMRILLMLCCWTGCRGQDGCLMRWSNVNMEQGTITYIPHKTARKTNNRAVSLPLHPELAEALREAAAFRDRNRPHEDYIIPSVAERYKRNHSGVQGDVQKIIICATGQDTTSSEDKGHRALRANLYSLHSFRHTFVSFCANAGVPLDVVGAIVGHGSIAMTRHYAHISDEAKEKAIKRLPVFQEQGNLPINREKLAAAISSLPDDKLYAIFNAIQKEGTGLSLGS